MLKTDCEQRSFHGNNNSARDKQLKTNEKKFQTVDGFYGNQCLNNNVLYVKDFKVTQFDTSLCFSCHSEIGCFRIDGNKAYLDSQVKPNLLQSSEMDGLLKKKINLLDGINLRIIKTIAFHLLKNSCLRIHFKIICSNVWVKSSNFFVLKL